MVRDKEHTCTLKLEAPELVCNQQVLYREQVSVSYATSLGYVFSAVDGNIYSKNVDLTTYINSKFLYAQVRGYMSNRSMYYAIT